MTTDLSKLQPSTSPPIPAEVLRELPLGNVYFWEMSGWKQLVRIDDWDGPWPVVSSRNRPFGNEWTRRAGPASGGPPRWAKEGHLFLAVDKIRAKGARGLGVFRVSSVEHVGRWRCPHCGGFDGPGGGMCCNELYRATPETDTLTPEELVLEGFPGADPDEFWAMLEKAGNVRDGMTWRIAFEEAK